jgi:hypothetical protein
MATAVGPPPRTTKPAVSRCGPAVADVFVVSESTIYGALVRVGDRVSTTAD